MAEIVVERCPETGICSIVRKDGAKVDLMPDEAEQLQRVRSNATKLREFLADINPGFARLLSEDEVHEIGLFLKT